MKKIAIVGAGFIGLSAARLLSKKGFDVSVFEKEKIPGGLAMGFKLENWQWDLEKHYHHIFAGDIRIQNLANKAEVDIFFKRPKTRSLIGEEIFPLDSPLDVLLFPKLSIPERLRMGVILAYLKFNPYWQPMEKIKASFWLKKYMGEKAYKTIWEPLLQGKFGKHTDEIALSWFWARIKKRTPNLGYPNGGFQNLAEALVKKIKKEGGRFYFGSEVEKIKKEKNKVKLGFLKTEDYLEFDKVIVTLPSFQFLQIAKDLPAGYVEKLKRLKGLSALDLVLVLNKPFFKDNTYWLNVCNRQYPFLAVVEHTNYIDAKHYNNNHIVYVGNYLPLDHPYLKLAKKQLLDIYHPYLKKISPNYQFSILNSQLFFAPFAQPIIPLNYSKIIPPFETPIENLYLANIQQVYPWDRGTNYAVELGEKVAEMIND